MSFPAQPVLASSIWVSQQQHGTDEACNENSKLPIGDKGLDTALDGGLEYGLVHSITASADQAGGKEILQAMLISHLRSSSTATATVIDSTHSLDIRRLFRALQAASASEKQAMQMLERLNISKVFDRIGLEQALLELQGITTAGQSDSRETTNKMPKSTIEDSEDEDEMFDRSSPPKEAQHIARLLIIDNISQIMAPEFKNNYTQGQALLSSFMRLLGDFTRMQRVCTVVLGDASAKPAVEDERLSMFKSCAIRPVLGVGFGYLVDVQMYLHSLPVKKSSARVGDMASVLEVVQDRHGGRCGKWAAFVCGADGKLESVP